jgi:hypothetical protein
MWGLITKTIDRCFAVGGSILFCQLPLLMQQYIQMLSGHLAEARHQLNLLQNTASLGNKTVQEYIQKFLGQSDLDFVNQGKLMQSMQSRYEDLSQAYGAIQESSVWMKPFVFASHIDTAVFWDTVKGFSPGISMNLETVIYALIGLVVGVMTYRLLAKITSAIVSCLFGAKKKEEDRLSTGRELRP